MSELAPSDSDGNYIRPKSNVKPVQQTSQIVQSVMDDFNTTDTPYVLYVGLACQWCHRAMLARVLCGWQSEVRIEYLQPGVDGLWLLGEEENEYGSLLKDVYLSLDKKYSGRFTAPLLVDDTTTSIKSNESADILLLFARDAPRVLTDDVVIWLRPTPQNKYNIDTETLEQLSQTLYENVNDGVYRCGFATSQKAYQTALDNLFSTLDKVEARLSKSRFLLSSSVITEPDIRLFPTIFRFDAVYAILFKATLKTIRADYPAISAWMRGKLPNYLPHSFRHHLTSLLDIYNLPGVPDTCDLDATRNNYYSSLFPLNPGGIVPVTPITDLTPVPERRGLGAGSVPV